MKTYKIFVFTTGIISWIYLFNSDWKLGATLFFILWFNNAQMGEQENERFEKLLDIVQDINNRREK